jgi:hypothetical protein
MAGEPHRVYVVFENQAGQSAVQQLVCGPYGTAFIHGMQLWGVTPEGSKLEVALRVKGGWQVRGGMRSDRDPVYDTVSFWPIVPKVYEQGTIKDGG